MTIAQQLKIKEFPFEIKDNKENIIYWEPKDGFWLKSEYDERGKEIYRETSDGFWTKTEYDDKGNRIYSECSSGVIFDDRPIYEIRKIYKQIKSECELPVALLTYTYKDFDGVLHPGASIAIDFRDSDEINIEKMEGVKSKYGEFFMFFNNSIEGREFWKNNPITITPKQ